MQILVVIPLHVELHLDLENIGEPRIVVIVDGPHDAIRRRVHCHHVNRIGGQIGVICPDQARTRSADCRHDCVNAGLAYRLRFFAPKGRYTLNRLDGVGIASDAGEQEQAVIRPAYLSFRAFKHGPDAQPVNFIIEKPFNAVLDALLDLAPT